jgi:hypothetical protein
MWFQTWDVPSAAVALLTTGWSSEVALYNALVFITFPLSAWTCALLCRELCSGRLAPFMAGLLYTFSTYHFAHAQMQLHVASMEWSPIYFLGLVRMANHRRVRDSVLTGCGLALATMASVYHLLFCVIGTVILAVCGSFGSYKDIISKRLASLITMSVAVYCVAAGWLVIGMVHSYLDDPYVGAHNAVRFSADIESFFVPNAVSVWSDVFTSWKHWTGNSWESCPYIGYTVLGLAVAGGVLNRAARPFLWLALVGAVLALGPHPHVGGVIYEHLALPEAWLAALVPALGFSGLPVRFSWLTTFGVSVAAASTLAWLCRRGRIGRAAAIVLTVLALVEAWPRPFVTSERRSPEIFVTWAQDKGHWAVLDATPVASALWHQMHHHHAIVAGYTTRFPSRGLARVNSDPVTAAFLPPPFGDGRPIFFSAVGGQRHLRHLGVRFVVVDDSRTTNAVALKLIERYRGDGLVVYEVPPA